MFSQKTPSSSINFQAGKRDFIDSLANWKLFFYLGWEDIRQRYVRTFLGPLWLIIGTSIWVLVMSFVMSSLFGHPLKTILPFIASGVMTWTFISSILNEGCHIFIKSTALIHAINLPLSIHVFRLVTHHFIIFLHHSVILFFVFLLCQVSFNYYTLLVIPGLLLLILNAIWISSFLGILNSRYRDIQQIVGTSMTVLPFITPIFWEKSFLKNNTWIANCNPIYHAIEIVRSPFLGKPASLLSWEIMIGITLFGFSFLLCFFSKYKHRIIHWVG